MASPIIQMVNLYHQFDTSRLYTLAQALGNAVRKLNLMINEAGDSAQTIRYMQGCIEDCEKELHQINDVFVERGEASF